MAAEDLHTADHVSPNYPFHAQESKPKQPLICLDIKISLSKTEQLLIFEHDDIDTVTEAFAREHSLAEQKKLKLLGILKK